MDPAQSETSPSPSPDPDFIRLWSEPVVAAAKARIREGRFELDGKSLAQVLARKINWGLEQRGQITRISAAQVDCWLEGTDVPRDEPTLHALLFAVGLNFSIVVNGKRVMHRETQDGKDKEMLPYEVKEWMKARAPVRQLILDRYESAFLEAETRPQADGIDAEKPCGHGYHPQKKDPYDGGRPIFPEVAEGRWHDPSALSYYDWETRCPGSLQRCIAATPSPAEILGCWRAMQPGEQGCMSGEELGDLTGLSPPTVWSFEHGVALPDPGNIRKIGLAMGEESQVFKDYSNQVIRVRLAIVKRHERNTNVRGVAAQWEHMPREYWREAIRQLLGGKANDPGSPPWASDVVPIRTQGQYFKAMRLSLNKPLCESIPVAAEAIGISKARLASVESDEDWSPQTRQKITEFYDTLQTLRLAGQDPYSAHANGPEQEWVFFDKTLCDPLNPKHLPMGKAERVAQSFQTKTRGAASGVSETGFTL